MQCNQCGQNNSEDSKFCGTCGAVLVAPLAPQPTLEYANDPTYGNYGTVGAGRSTSSRPVGMVLYGIVGAGMVIFACLACLIGSVISLSTLRSAGAVASVPTPTLADDVSVSETAVATAPATAPASAAVAAQSASTAVPTGSAAAQSTPAPTLRKSTAQRTSSSAAPSTSSFQKWTVQQVLSAFGFGGQEISNPQPMSKADYGQIPAVATNGVKFVLPSLGGTKGGHIFSFSDAASLQKVQSYYERGGGSAIPPWIFVRDNILVQLNGQLPRSRAIQYQNTLNTMR